MDSYATHISRILNVLAVYILLLKNRWTKPEVRLTKTIHKYPGTVIRLDSR